MIGLALVGGLVGAALFGVLWLLVPRRTSALVTLARYDADMAARSSPAATGTSSSAPLGGGWRSPAGAQARLGALVAGWLTQRGIAYTTLRQDVVLTGRSFEATIGRKVLAGVTGFVLTFVAAAGLRTDGLLALPVASSVVFAVAAGAALFFVPDLEVRTEARARRADFRAALGSFLDLVALEMAGAAAPAEALPSAARIGSGWAMALIRDCLYRATKSGQDHWQALTDLGLRIGVPELAELGALIYRVRRDGARVRETLTARSASMRRARQADAEGEARRQDESMLVAQILLGLGFVAFLTYPALMNVIVQ